KLINQRMTNLKAYNCLRLFHGSTNNCASVLPTIINVDLFISLVYFGFKSPVKSNFINCWKEDISDLWIGWCKVAKWYFRKFPRLIAKTCTPNPSFATTKSSNECPKLIRQLQKISLRHI